MPSSVETQPKRIDAQRNRARILVAARRAFAGDDARSVSMAEIARRAGVGMATLYRNFPGRQELLEAAFTEEVDQICSRAETSGSSGEDFFAWLALFFDFAYARSEVAAELIRVGGLKTDVFRRDQKRITDAAAPMLQAAIASHSCSSLLSVGQILDGVVYIAQINEDLEYVHPIFVTFIAGLKTDLA